jgi:putative ATP-dependent endonuclease of OLD family
MPTLMISDLEISNFRGIRTGRVRFDTFTVLVGANNSGKTTITEAMALLLGRDRLVRTLTEHDFFGSTPRPQDRIKIIATITGFTPNDPDRHPEWFRMGRAVIKWWNPSQATITPTSNTAGDQLACQIAFAARFDRETLEVETARYFYDGPGQDDPFDEESAVTPVPISLIKDLGFFLVPAGRTWDRMISFSSELFRRAVAYAGGNPAATVLDERDRLRSPASPIEQDPKLESLVGHVNADIARLFGRPAQLKLRLTTTDSEGVLDAVVPHFVEGDAVPLPSRRHGSGLISLQTLILLMRFGNLRLANQEAFLMAIEEPELHVPPPLQRKLLHLMQSLATQTIITTHSPTVAAVPEPHQLVLVVNRNGSLQAQRLLAAPLAHDASNPERSLFLSDREATVTAIMHPCVLIPEGKTDAAWLRLFARIIDLLAPDPDPAAAPSFTHEVGVIPTKDARIADTFTHLHGVHPSLTCLVDGDSAGRAYITQLCGLSSAPRTIIRWPDNWAMEHVVVWIVSADTTILANSDLAAAGVPNAIPAFLAALSSSLKSNEVVHGLIADAISRSPAVMRRVSHVLGVLGAIAAGRQPSPGTASMTMSASGQTTIWTFSDAFSGI